MGSQRSRALSAELAKLGNQVVVFTQDFEDPAPVPENVQVVRLGTYSADLWPRTGLRGLVRKSLMALAIAPTVLPVFILKIRRKQGLSASQRQLFWELNQRRASSVLRLDQILSTRIWLRGARSQISVLSSQEAPFDVIFSTSHSLGRFLMERGVAHRWVDDFRDVADAPVFLPAVRAYLRFDQDRLLRDADWTTTISAGVRKALESSRIGNKVSDRISVVTNGFREQLDLPPAPNGIAPLKIGYTGALYGPRNGELRRLFSLLKTVSKSTGTPIEFHYAGRTAGDCTALAEEVGVEDLLVLHGKLTHAESLKLQSQMDALVVLSWNTEDEQGILSGKFLEYLGSDRPIIAMVGGDKPGSELCEAMAKLSVGVCFEAARAPEDLPILENWLTEAARDRSRGRAVKFEPDDEEVQKYNYANIASQLELILREVALLV